MAESTYVPRATKKWGPETPDGLKILRIIQDERHQTAKHDDEPPAKRRKSRWAPATVIAKVGVPGVPGVELSREVAALASTFDPAAMKLEHELIQVCEHERMPH
jgi:hypothetical protein